MARVVLRVVIDAIRRVTVNAVIIFVSVSKKVHDFHAYGVKRPLDCYVLNDCNE